MSIGLMPFGYVRPRTVAEACQLLAEDPEAKLMAGGMTLLPTIKQRLASPSRLIDLAGIESLRGITVEGDTLVVGAMTRHADVAASPLVKAHIPALADLAQGIGDPHVRNRGTMGGATSNADPAADYPAAIVGLGATLVTSARTIAADDFFVDLFETALERGEILTALRFPIPQAAGYVKFPNPASRYATVGVFVAKWHDRVRLGVTGAAPCAFRLFVTESALEERFAPDAIEPIQLDRTALNGDGHADTDYRDHLVTVIARRAVAACVARMGPVVS
jgi:carbon-monoxide dehydrogenase medium subunit